MVMLARKGPRTRINVLTSHVPIKEATLGDYAWVLGANFAFCTIAGATVYGFVQTMLSLNN